MNAPAVSTDTSFFGHPRGLSTLFFSEMWERFSYYGMRGFLILYMTAAVTAGGMGLDTATAAAIYGTYTSLVYLMSIPGGWLADRVLGQRKAVLYGGILIACGHFTLAIPLAGSFYVGLVLIVLGTGLLKPNISAIVGQLYGANDFRRDAGFSIFYMGINLGAFMGPLLTGFLAQDPGFRSLISGWGMDPNSAWHWAFGAAGVGMTLGLIQYVVMGPAMGSAGTEARRSDHAGAGGEVQASGGSLRRWRHGGGGRHRTARAGRRYLDFSDHRPGLYRLFTARHHRRLLRHAVPRSELDTTGARPPVGDLRVLHLRGGLLVGVRAGRLDAEPVRRPQHTEHVPGIQFPE
jgi:MFS family permease